MDKAYLHAEYLKNCLEEKMKLPTELLVSLLEEKIKACTHEGKQWCIVRNFPQSVHELNEFEMMVSISTCDVCRTLLISVRYRIPIIQCM